MIIFSQWTVGIEISSSSTQNIILIIQAVILFCGLGVTALTIWSNRQDNRKQATLQLILHQRSNKELNEAIDLMAKLARDGKEKNEFSDLSKHLENFDSAERQAILMVLNYREFVAVGINTGVIDEETYKRAYYNLMLRDWQYLSNTVNAIRNSPTGKPTNFKDFQNLAERWEKKKLKVT